MGDGKSKTGLAALLGVGLLLVIVPLLALLWTETGRPEAAPESLWAVIQQGHLRSLLLSSLATAAAVATGALLVGTVIGLLLAAARGWPLRLLLPIHILPLCLPPYASALGWAELAGPAGPLGPCAGQALSALLYSRTGLILVLTLALSPIVSLLTWAFASSMDGAAVEAAHTLRPPGAVLRRVVLPACLPGLALGGFLVFVLALGEVAVPQLLRVPVYASTVFSRLADLSFAPLEALARAWPLIFVALAVALACHVTERRGREALGLKEAGQAHRLPRPLQWAGWTLLIGVALAGALPLCALLAMGFWGPGGGLSGLAASLDAMANSLRYAAVGATIMLALAAPAGFVGSRRPGAMQIASLPWLLGLCLPAVVLGLGLLMSWGRLGGSWLSGGMGLVLLGLSARYFYPVLRAAQLGFDRLPESWLEAARLHQGSALSRFVRIILPSSLPVLATAWTLGFLLLLRDMDTSVIFYPPGGESLPVRALTLEANAPPGLSAAAASLEVLMTGAALALLALAARLGRRSK